MDSEKQGVRFSSSTSQKVECVECGELSPNTPTERDCFSIAHRHARQNAHKVIVTSTVTTTMAGYVDERRHH